MKEVNLSYTLNLYGKQAEDLKAHCLRLLDVYEKTVVANRKMAEMHQEMAR